MDAVRNSNTGTTNWQTHELALQSEKIWRNVDMLNMLIEREKNWEVQKRMCDEILLSDTRETENILPPNLRPSARKFWNSK